MPKIRIPLWLALVLPLAAYAFRSVVLRGGDWRPDLPWDPVVFGMLAVLIVLVGVMRARAAREDDEARVREDGDHKTRAANAVGDGEHDDGEPHGDAHDEHERDSFT